MWAAGITLLEMAVGYPVWINEKCIVKHVNLRNFLAPSGILNFEALFIKAGMVRMMNVQQQRFKSEDRIRLLLKKAGGSYDIHYDPNFVNLLSRML